MHSLRFVLSNINNPSPQVQDLLNCLAADDFSLDVIICSFGGVGSTELSNFLTRNGLKTNLLKDTDNLRHCNRPPAQVPGLARVVYLYGEPLLAVASHYRRGQAHHQATKTNSEMRLSPDAFPADFQAYLAAGRDLFGLEQHFSNWLHAEVNYDIIFVRYEDMFHKEVALQLFGALFKGRASDGHIAQLAAEFAASKQPRKSQVSPDDLPRMYGSLRSSMAQLPPLHVRSATRASSGC